MEDKLLSIIEEIPNAVGVYFIYDKLDRLLYVGKSKHIKKRLMQHFKSTDYRELRIRQEIGRIDYELLGDETIALLHESDLIKLHQPKYNRALRKKRYSFGLYAQVDVNGYISLYVDRLVIGKNEIMTFTSYREGKERLFTITEKYNLCQKINQLYKSKSSCFQYQLKACYGACIAKEEIQNYNQRVNNFIASSELPDGELFLEVVGRHENEKGIIYLKDGAYKGFGYCKKGARSKNVFFKCVQLKEENRDSRRIIKRHIINRNAMVI